MAEATQSAVVVGATGSMGKVISERLQRAGLAVIAVGRGEAALGALERQLPGLRGCVADMASDTAVEAIRRQLDRPVRMVVHAAGLPPSAMGSLLKVSTAAVAQSLEIKVGGMIRLVRAVDEHLAAGSRLVAIAGHLGLEPTALAANPGIANAALVNLMRQYSLLYGKRGVSAHVIAPGPTETERLARAVAGRAASLGITEAAMREEMRAELPFNAIASCEQVAWAVSLLLAPEAEVITGSTLSLDYGRRRGIP